MSSCIAAPHRVWYWTGPRRGNLLARDDLIQIKGTITEALAGGNYRVKGDNGMEFLAYSTLGGTLLGALILAVIGASFNMLLLPFAWSLVVTGGIILLAVFAQRPRIA